ncbi:fluoride efflux transporter CrcB [Alkalilimnicola ehrlichii]|uniref:fluoride efflux transporter CrcB n=1 Tax=Alkalilimnicola ehrlichii TaxID=351052 RepID=UPI003BA1EFC9
METVQSLVLVALGGGVGAVARWWCNARITARVEGGFPWGTWAVNGAGSLLIGLLAGLLAPGSEAALLLMIGFCGSFTTVSSFGLQTAQLIDDGRWGAVVLYVTGSLLTCLAAVSAGLWLAGVGQ